MNSHTRESLLEAGAKFIDHDTEWWEKLIAEFTQKTVEAECRSLKGSSTTARARVIEQRLRAKVAALEKDAADHDEEQRRVAEKQEQRRRRDESRHLDQKIADLNALAQQRWPKYEHLLPLVPDDKPPLKAFVKALRAGNVRAIAVDRVLRWLREHGHLEAAA